MRLPTLIVLLLIVLSAFMPLVWGDSAEAWKTFQEGRNPALEFLYLIVGLAAGAVLLVFVNKLNQKAIKRKKRSRRKK